MNECWNVQTPVDMGAVRREAAEIAATKRRAGTKVSALFEFLEQQLSSEESSARVNAEQVGRKVPTFVLDSLEAQRRIIGDHAPVDVSDRFPGVTPRCSRCHNVETPDEDRHMFAAWPCPTLRYLAFPYRHHQDYRNEWRP